jgi:hypothetical protein
MGCDLVAGFRQMTFHRLPEGRVVIDYVYEPLHGSLRERSQAIKRLQSEHINFVGSVRLAEDIRGRAGSRKLDQHALLTRPGPAARKGLGDETRAALENKKLAQDVLN